MDAVIFGLLMCASWLFLHGFAYLLFKSWKIREAYAEFRRPREGLKSLRGTIMYFVRAYTLFAFCAFVFGCALFTIWIVTIGLPSLF